MRILANSFRPVYLAENDIIHLDMYDQPNDKPVLSLQEELDVLEAVWKVGREKGLDLLRPEQKKKLVDGGRITSAEIAGTAEEDIEPSTETNPKVIQQMTVDEIVATLVETVGEFVAEEFDDQTWSSFTDRQKLLMINARMYVSLGLSIKMLRKKVESLIGEV